MVARFCRGGLMGLVEAGCMVSWKVLAKIGHCIKLFATIFWVK